MNSGVPISFGRLGTPEEIAAPSIPWKMNAVPPYTLHPAPCTLHPAPFTLCPAPCTLHPAPCTPRHTSGATIAASGSRCAGASVISGRYAAHSRDTGVKRIATPSHSLTGGSRLIYEGVATS